jgi:uncharacterized protein (TIGR00661 family)
LKTVAFYISDYGFGHASRSIAIIRKLLNEQDIKVIVCNSFSLNFIKKSLNSGKVQYRNIRTDVGYFLKEKSIYPDKIRLYQEYRNFLVNWNERVSKEQSFLENNKVDLVLSDISPIPFEASANLGIPSIGISNFTWYTAYQGLINESDLETLKNAYQKMNYFFELPGSQEEWNTNSKQYGFFSRKIDPHEVQKVKQHLNPKRNFKVVFLGLGMKIDVGPLNEYKIWDSSNCVFIVSSNMDIDRPNVIKIPNDYLESQNYIAASDLVISKAGWGIIGEALTANVPLLIIDRPSMKEDLNTIAYLKKHNLCETINWEKFKTYKVNSIYIDEQKGLMNKSDNIHVDTIVPDILKILKNFS